MSKCLYYQITKQNILRIGKRYLFVLRTAPAGAASFAVLAMESGDGGKVKSSSVRQKGRSETQGISDLPSMYRPMTAEYFISSRLFSPRRTSIMTRRTAPMEIYAPFANSVTIDMMQNTGDKESCRRNMPVLHRYFQTYSK